MTATEDVDAIRAAVRDYVEGWFDGDGTRMQRAVHPELVSGTVTKAVACGRCRRGT
jgi:Putative lumazine-binding